MAMSAFVAIYPTVEEILEKYPKECSVCKKSFSNPSACRMHVVKVHGIVTNGREERMKHAHQKPFSVAQYYCCDNLCRQRLKHFSEMKLLKQHYQKCHMERSLLCPHCGLKRFALTRDLEYHVRSTCHAAAVPSCSSGVVPSSRSAKRVKDGRQKIENEKTIDVYDESSNSNFQVTHVGVLPPGKAVLIMVTDSQNVEETLHSMSLGCSNLSTVACQTEKGQMPQTIFNEEQQMVYQNDPCFGRQDSHCQTNVSSSFSLPTHSDFGTQIERTFFEETPQVRHVETSMESMEDWRSIETQTLPLWTEGDSSNYWFDGNDTSTVYPFTPHVHLGDKNSN